MNSKDTIYRIFESGSQEERLALFGFDGKNNPIQIRKKFTLFSRFFFSRYFNSKDSEDHKRMVENIIKAYLGEINYLDIAYRGFAKTTYGKVLLVYLLTNDRRDNRRKYIKILTKDLKNSKQIVTDVYNMLLEVKPLYGDMFMKEGEKKREETMGSFTTSNQVKLTAGTIGQTQRGHVQDAYRPDWIWFDDVEDRDSIRSSVKTVAIIDSIEEAISGLSTDGTYFVTANYISEYGAVQHFKDKTHIVTDIFPILDENGNPTWERFTPEKIEELKADAMDWWGEYMCDPTRSDDKFFPIDVLDEFEILEPIKNEAGYLVFEEYNPVYRYSIGADIAGGNGLDSSTAVVLNLSKGTVAGIYYNNNIVPDVFAHELARIGNKYGACIIAPENNSIGLSTIDTLRGIYNNIYIETSRFTINPHMTQKFGWNTNSRTKPDMLYKLRSGIAEGLLVINQKELKQELKSYSFNDLQDNAEPLATRHFDLLMALGIAWAVKDFAPQKQDPLERYENFKKRQSKINTRTGM